MKTYIVSFKFSGRATYEIEAENKKNAEEKALYKWTNFRFGANADEPEFWTSDIEKNTVNIEEDEELCTCEFCGFSEGWGETDTVHGDIWSCEVCGKTFCSKCFIDRFGTKKYLDMMQSGEYIRCPDCFEEAEKDVKRK